MAVPECLFSHDAAHLLLPIKGQKEKISFDFQHVPWDNKTNYQLFSKLLFVKSKVLGFSVMKTLMKAFLSERLG